MVENYVVSALVSIHSRLNKPGESVSQPSSYHPFDVSIHSRLNKPGESTYWRSTRRTGKGFNPLPTK